MKQGVLVAIRLANGQTVVGAWLTEDGASIRVKDAVIKVPWWRWWQNDFHVYPLMDVQRGAMIWCATTEDTSWPKWYQSRLNAVKEFGPG